MEHIASFFSQQWVSITRQEHIDLKWWAGYWETQREGHVLLSKYRYAQPSNRHLQDLNDQGLPVSPGPPAGGLQALKPLVLQRVCEKSESCLWNELIKLLQGRQLALSRTNQGPRQARPLGEAELADQGLMGSAPRSTLPRDADRLILQGMDRPNSYPRTFQGHWLNWCFLPVRFSYAIFWSCLTNWCRTIMSETVLNLYEAKTSLSKLVDRAAAGEEIIIAKSGHPLAKLVPLDQKHKRRTPGGWEGKVMIANDFDAPLPTASNNGDFL